MDPLMVVIGIILLWQLLGPACLAGLGFMILVVPVNAFLIGGKIESLQVPDSVIECIM